VPRLRRAETHARPRVLRTVRRRAVRPMQSPGQYASPPVQSIRTPPTTVRGLRRGVVVSTRPALRRMPDQLLRQMQSRRRTAPTRSAPPRAEAFSRARLRGRLERGAHRELLDGAPRCWARRRFRTSAGHGARSSVEVTHAPGLPPSRHHPAVFPQCHLGCRDRDGAPPARAGRRPRDP